MLATRRLDTVFLCACMYVQAAYLPYLEGMRV